MKMERLEEIETKKTKELQQFKLQNLDQLESDDELSDEKNLDQNLNEINVNPLKYLDGIIDEYVDLILVNHKVQKDK